MMIALADRPYAINFIPIEEQDKEMWMIAAATNGYAVENLPIELQNDKDILLTACQ